MIGVVLWSDPADRKAVFWCEDQGDLAFYQAPDCALDSLVFFAAGDMVQFDTVNSRKLRKANNAKLLQGEACIGLPDQLRETSHHAGQSAVQSACILPFVAPERTDQDARARSIRNA